MNDFNKQAFETAFDISINKLAESEKVTKSELKTVSRSILQATHETGQVMYMNKLVSILTPVNKKVAVLFLKAFTGYIYDEVLGAFTKKSKKKYDEAFADYVEFMNDPHNNIWTWANKHVEVAHKPFSLDKVTSFMTNALKQAKGVGLTDVDIIKAVMKAGITPDAMLAIMSDDSIMGDMGFDVEIKGDIPVAQDMSALV
jgi:hypothetical protein